MATSWLTDSTLAAIRGASPAPAAEPDVQLAERLGRRLLRLAADVHDGPMQDLTAIGFGLGELRRQIELVVPAAERSAVDASFDELLAECVRVERSLRALISSLEGGLSDSASLAEAIAEEVETFGRRSDAEVELELDEDAEAETDSQRIALQAVAREALSNVAKHSGASRVWIRLRRTSEGLTELAVRDDGAGFDVESALTRERLGLTGMQTRVSLLGGELTIVSAPGADTTVTATLRPWRNGV
jgi:signal transduction histidine kinase